MNQRHHQRLSTDGRKVIVNDLTEQLELSQATIRQDLKIANRTIIASNAFIACQIGRIALSRHCGTEDVELLITDQKPADIFLEKPEWD